MHADREGYSAQVQRIQAALRKAGWGALTDESTSACTAYAPAPSTGVYLAQSPPPPVSSVLRAQDVNASACTTSRKTGSVDGVVSRPVYGQDINATRAPEGAVHVTPTRPVETPRLFQRLMCNTGSDSTLTVEPAASKNLFDELIAKAWANDAASGLAQRHTAACTMHAKSAAARTPSLEVSVSPLSSPAAAGATPRRSASGSASAASSTGEAPHRHMPTPHVDGTTSASTRASGRRPATRITSAAGCEPRTATSEAATVKTRGPAVCSTTDVHASDVVTPTPSLRHTPLSRCVPQRGSSSRPTSQGVGVAAGTAAPAPSQRQRRLLRAVQLAEAALQRGTGGGRSAVKSLLFRLRVSSLGNVLQTLTDAHGRTLMPHANALSRAELGRLRDTLVRELLASHAALCSARCAPPSPPLAGLVEGGASRAQESGVMTAGEERTLLDGWFSSAERRPTSSASPTTPTTWATAEDRERSRSVSFRDPLHEAPEVAATVEEDPYAVSLRRFAQEAASVRAVQERRRLGSAP